MRRFLIALVGCLIGAQLHAECGCETKKNPVLSTPFLTTRSQGQDSARWLAGWAHKVNLYTDDDWYSAFSVTPEYTQTFAGHATAWALFGEDIQWNCFDPFIYVSGSTVHPPRDPFHDWLADYFGLPTDFESRISINPSVKNFIIDFNWYWGLNFCHPGLYFNFFMPIVHTRWNLGLCERIINPGTQGYNQGYFTPDAVPRSQLLNSFLEFADDQLAPELGDGVTFCPLKNARLSRKTLSKTGIADLHGVFGWNFIQNEEYHVGLNLRLVYPTGTRPQGIHVFEPIVGNGHFFELGVGVSTHGLIWVDEEKGREAGVYVEAWWTHMFGTQQRRFFDLKNSENSRYELVSLFTEDVQGDLGSVDTPADAQFSNLYMPLANVSTLECHVSVPWQADLTLMLNYAACDFEWDVGFNFWSKRPEHIHIETDFCNDLITTQSWGVKGDSQMFGFVEGTNAPIALSATQTLSTVNTGLNLQVPNSLLNPSIDNATKAYSDVTPILDLPGGTQTNTSIQPRFIRNRSLALCQSATHGLSYAMFTHLSYTWQCSDRLETYFGVGGKYEIAPDAPMQNCPSLCTNIPSLGPSPCGTCDDDTLLQSGLSQWGVWIKGGIWFN